MGLGDHPTWQRVSTFQGPQSHIATASPDCGLGDTIVELTLFDAPNWKPQAEAHGVTHSHIGLVMGDPEMLMPVLQGSCRRKTHRNHLAPMWLSEYLSAFSHVHFYQQA